MTFGASLDSGGVGAEGTAAWLYKEDSSNTLTAYYLFRDDGVYFDTAIKECIRCPDKSEYMKCKENVN